MDMQPDLKTLADTLRNVIVDSEFEDLDDDVTQGSLRSLIFVILKATATYRGGPTLEGKSEWTDGARGHYESGRQDFSAETIEAMGQVMADHARVRPEHLEDVKWTIPMTDAERSLLYAAYVNRRTYNAKLTLLHGAVARAHWEYDAALKAKNQLAQEIETLGPDLNENAYHRKIVELDAAKMLVDIRQSSLNDAEAALKRGPV